MTTWVDFPRPGFRALGLALLIHEARWDDVEQMLAGVAEREGIAAMEALDAQALGILERIDEDELDEAYGDLTAGRP